MYIDIYLSTKIFNNKYTLQNFDSCPPNFVEH